MKATADSPTMLTNQWPLIGHPDDIVPASGTLPMPVLRGRALAPEERPRIPGVSFTELPNDVDVATR